jgi:hypothetical protein
MKKIIIAKKHSIKCGVILLFVWILPLCTIAGDGTDTVFYQEKSGKKYYIMKGNRIFKSKKYYSDFLLDWGYNRLDSRNMFTGAEHESAAGFPNLRNSASQSFSMYAMFGRKLSNSLSIMSGLGIDWVNYKFNQDVTIQDINGVATQIPIESVLNTFSYMKKSKLTGSYINVPLLLKIHIHNRFFIAAGVTGGVNIGSHTKVVFIDTNGKKQKYKDYNIDLATFRYGYSVRAGFRKFSIYTNYYVSPLFDKDKGPQVYPFVIGISLRLW